MEWAELHLPPGARSIETAPDTTNSMAKTHKKRPAPSSAPAAPRIDEESTRGTPGMRPDEMPADVLEFITAVDDYKRIHRRPFPTWSEILEILKGLGYTRSR
jgi:hypothetical protein